jgi:hypothetical protein
MSEPAEDDRRARGLAMFQEVYGDIVPAPPPGAAPAFELLIGSSPKCGHDAPYRYRCGGYSPSVSWQRRAESTPCRCSSGVTLDVGELTVEQVRKAAIDLTAPGHS